MSTTVLVIGAGATGMRAAYDLAESGAQVLLIERSPVIGGVMAPRLNGDGDDWALAGGVQPPLTREIQEHERIEVLTLAQLTALKGEIGHFRAIIHQDARFVTDACTLCGHCRPVCPVVRANPFNGNLTHRKAIYLPLRDGVPAPFTIDIESCLNDPPNYLPCQRCVAVCEDNAITFDAPIERQLERSVSTVIVAVGYEPAAPAIMDRCGYGLHPDILTSLELDRMMTATGPTGGDVEKPSNSTHPESVLIYLADHSQFSWTYTAYQTAQLAEQDIRNITVLYPNKDACTAEFEELWSSTAAEGVKLVQGNMEKVSTDDDDTLAVRYRDVNLDRSFTQVCDMVVLTNAPVPSSGLDSLANALEIDMRDDGYLLTGEGRNNGGGTGFSSSRPGVYVVGCASGPRNIAESMEGIKAAVERALYHVDLRLTDEQVSVNIGPERVETGERRLSEDDIQARFEQLVSKIVALGEKSAAQANGNGA